MTTNNQKKIRLSIEELSVIISLIGYPDIAKGLLLGQLGEISEDEEKGRLLAANHTLLAKDVLLVQGKQTRLDESIVHLVSPLIKNNFSVRGSLGGAGRTEEILTYYVRDGKIIEHQIILGVVHELSTVKSSQEIAAKFGDFFELEKSAGFDCSPFTISPDQLEEAKIKAASSEEQVFSYLAKAGVPEKAGQLLAGDLHQPDYRGSVIRIDQVNLVT